MINTTDLQEVEVLLPGEWRREDNGDIYAFTTDKMELEDERLFKQLVIRHAAPVTDPPAAAPVESTKWALAIKDDYFGIIVGNYEFIISEIGRRKDGVMTMTWEAANGVMIIQFIKQS
jgi:hypothetical protein